MKTIVAPNVTRPNWGNGAYTIAFVYSNKGNFAVKGFYGDVEKLINEYKSQGYKYFANFTLWQNGKYRNLWKCSTPRVYIHGPSLDAKSLSALSYPYHFKISKFGKDGSKTGSYKLKRMPSRYINEIFE